jgi:HEAT repeat protein
MKCLLLIGVLGLWVPGQDREEITFTRVHLLNGNFIDGQLVKNTPNEVILKLKYGEMAIRRDLIARDSTGKYRVELIRLRSITDKPKTVDKPGSGDVKPSVTPAPAVNNSGTPEPYAPPPEVRQKIDAIFQDVRKAGTEQKYTASQQLIPLGREAAMFLASGMDTFDDEILTHTVPVLGEMKERAVVPVLLQQLHSKRPLVRTQAVFVLGALGDPEAIPGLIAALTDAAPTVKAPAIDALVQLNARQAFPKIAQLCGDPDPTVRSRAIAGLFSLAQKNEMQREVAAVLSDVLDRTKGEARAEILMAFGRTGKKEGAQSVVPHLSDDDAKVRAAAAVALGNMGATEAGDAIVNRLGVEQDKWPWIYMVGAAVKLKVTRAAEPLIRALTSTDNEMRLTALQALRSLSGENHGFDKAAWQAWWDRQRR